MSRLYGALLCKGKRFWKINLNQSFLTIIIITQWFKVLLLTPHLEANKYLSKIRKSSSCIFSKYYMLTDKKQKNENFLLSRFFLMWTWSYTVKIGFLRGFKTKIIKYKMQKCSEACQACRISENTLYLFDKKDLSSF